MNLKLISRLLTVTRELIARWRRKPLPGLMGKLDWDPLYDYKAEWERG